MSWMIFFFLSRLATLFFKKMLYHCYQCTISALLHGNNAMGHWYHGCVSWMLFLFLFLSRLSTLLKKMLYHWYQYTISALSFVNNAMGHWCRAQENFIYPCRIGDRHHSRELVQYTVGLLNIKLPSQQGVGATRTLYILW